MGSLGAPGAPSTAPQAEAASLAGPTPGHGHPGLAPRACFSEGRFAAARPASPETVSDRGRRLPGLDVPKSCHSSPALRADVWGPGLGQRPVHGGPGFRENNASREPGS